MLGIIGGTGLTALNTLHITRRKIERTPYGETSQALSFGYLEGHEVVFLARHGLGCTIPPHTVNYRANLWALHNVGVRDAIAVSTVGAIANSLHRGSIVLPHQLIDYTQGRPSTFQDGIHLPVLRVDFTHPYNPDMRALCLAAASKSGIPLHDGGVYAVTQGPRLETAAEIDKLERDGATIVGMTSMPEAVLARELDMRYALICPVTNAAAGRAESAAGIDHAQASASLDVAMQQIRTLLVTIVDLYSCSTHIGVKKNGQ